MMSKYDISRRRLNRWLENQQEHNPDYSAIRGAWLNYYGYTPYQFGQTMLFSEAMAKTKALNQQYFKNTSIMARPAYKVFTDNFRGKLGEFACYNWLKANGIKSTKPSIWVNSSEHRGDIGADLNVNGHPVEIKSMHFWSKSLILPARKWRYQDGRVSNYDSSGKMRGRMPDVFILVHVSELKTTDSGSRITKQNYPDILAHHVDVLPTVTRPFDAIRGCTVANAVKQGKSLFRSYVPTSHDMRATGMPQKMRAPSYDFPSRSAYINPKALRADDTCVVYEDSLKTGLQVLDKPVSPVRQASEVISKRKEMNTMNEVKSYATETDPRNPLAKLYAGETGAIDPFSKNYNQLKAGAVCHEAEIFGDKSVMQVDWTKVSQHQGKILRSEHSKVISDSPKQLKEDALSEDPKRLQHVMHAAERMPYEKYDGSSISKAYTAMATKISALKHYKMTADNAYPKQFNAADTKIAVDTVKSSIDNDIKEARKKNVCDPAPKIIYSFDNQKYRDLVPKFKHCGMDTDKLKKVIHAVPRGTGTQYYLKYCKRCDNVNAWRKKHQVKKMHAKLAHKINQNDGLSLS